MASPRCQRINGMTPTLSQDIATKLSEIPNVFPRTRFICVINSAGELLGSLTLEEQPSQDLLYAMSSLQQTAFQFSNTLDSRSCPVIHVTGETQMLSCYEAGPCIIAFYTEINHLEFDILDVSQQDSQMISIIEDIRLLVNSLLTAKTDSK